MIAALLALAQASPATVGGTPFGVLPQQALPATGCAAYLWSATEPHRLVAMASADAGRLRVVLDGQATDLPRADAGDAIGFGFAGETRYRVGDTQATLDLTIVTSAGLTKGATVPQASLRLERPGQDGAVLPLAGFIGCAS